MLLCTGSKGRSLDERQWKGHTNELRPFIETNKHNSHVFGLWKKVKIPNISLILLEIKNMIHCKKEVRKTLVWKTYLGVLPNYKEIWHGKHSFHVVMLPSSGIVIMSIDHYQYWPNRILAWIMNTFITHFVEWNVIKVLNSNINQRTIANRLQKV